MAAPTRYTHEEIMRRYGFTGLRVAQWETPSAYTFDRTSRQFQLRQAPQTYRYVIPRENIPEPTDDEASEEEEGEADVEADSGPAADTGTQADTTSTTVVDPLDALLAGTDMQSNTAKPVADDVNALLAGILKSTPPLTPEGATAAAAVVEAPPDKTQEKPKAKAKGKLRSAWSKPSTKSKTKSTKAATEKTATAAAVVVPPEAPDPPQVLVLDDPVSVEAGAQPEEATPETIQDGQSVPIPDAAVPADIEGTSKQIDAINDTATETTAQTAPAGDGLESAPIQEEAGEESTSAANDQEEAVREEAVSEEPAKEEPAKEEPAEEEPAEEASTTVAADDKANSSEESAVNEPAATADTNSPDPLADILAKLDDILPPAPPPAQDEYQADDKETIPPTAAGTDAKPDPLADLLAELALPPTAAAVVDPEVVPEATVKIMDEPETDSMTADDASAVASVGSEDKHVSFAPGTPEPKPTKRKKRPTKDKNKRRPSISKTDGVQPASEVSAASSNPPVEDLVSADTQNSTENAIVDDEPKVVAEAVTEHNAHEDKGPSVSKKGTTRPRASSKSTGMFAAGGLLGFAAMSKSSKSSKSKGKDKKKKDEAKDASKSAEDASGAAVGLGITSPTDDVLEDDAVEAVVEVPTPAVLEDLKEDTETTSDAAASTAEGDSAAVDEHTAATAETPNGDAVESETAEEAQPADQVLDITPDTVDEQSGSANDSQLEPEATTVTDAAVIAEEQADDVEKADPAEEANMEAAAAEATEENLEASQTPETTEPVSFNEAASSSAHDETLAEVVSSLDVKNEQLAPSDAVEPLPEASVDAQAEVEEPDKVSRHDSGFAESVEDATQDHANAGELPEKIAMQEVVHTEETSDAIVESISTTVAATEKTSEEADASNVEGVAAADIVPAVEGEATVQHDEPMQDVTEGEQPSEAEPDAGKVTSSGDHIGVIAATQDEDIPDEIVPPNVAPSEELTSVMQNANTATNTEGEGVSTDVIPQGVQEAPLDETGEHEAQELITASNGVISATADADLASSDNTTEAIHEAKPTEEIPLHDTLMTEDVSDPTVEEATPSDNTADAEVVGNAETVALETTQHTETIASPEQTTVPEDADNNSEQPEVPENEIITGTSDQKNTAEEEVEEAQPSPIIDSTKPIVESEATHEGVQETAEVSDPSPVAPVEVQTAHDTPTIDIDEVAAPVAEKSDEQHEEHQAVSDEPLPESDAIGGPIAEAQPVAEPESTVEQEPAETPSAIMEREPESTTSIPVATNTEESRPFVTEIVEPADVTTAQSPAIPDATSAEPFVAEIVIPTVVAATIPEAPPSPTQSRTSRRHRSERSDRPRSSKKPTEPSSREKDTRYQGRSERSTRDRRGGDEDAERRRRRDARKAEEMRRVAEDERRSIEEEEHRRIRREARHAAKKAQEAEEAAKVAREQAEAMARQDADARRRRREQRSERPERRDSDITRPKLAGLSFMSGLSIGSSSSKTGLFVRTKDERPRGDNREGGKRASYEMEPRKRERRDSVIPKAVSPTDLKSTSRDFERDAGSGQDRAKISKQESTNKASPRDIGRSSTSERRHRTEKPEGEPGRTNSSKHDSRSNADPRDVTEASTSERRRRTEKQQAGQPQRKRRPSERNDKRPPTETKSAGFFGSIFR